MPIRKHRTIKPQYYDKFSCIGSQCEDNCCSRQWSINIDKRSYTQYKKIKDPELSGLISQHVRRIKGSDSSDGSYARFVLDEDFNCPIQTEDGLCKLQLKYGGESLCITCQVYPRSAKSINGEFAELSMSMSCPEVARLALLDTEPMEFNAGIVELDSDSALMRSGIAAPREPNPPTAYIQYGWQMRDAAIDIMQCRRYPVSTRIFIIGMMLRRVVELHDSGKHSEIADALGMYHSAALNGEFSDALSKITPAEHLKTLAMETIYQAFFQTTISRRLTLYLSLRDRFFYVLSSILNETGFDPEKAEPIQILPHFNAFILEMTKERWDEFERDFGHVLENYFVNYMFSEIFPLKFHADGLNPYHHVLLLAEQYAQLRILLCGNYNAETGFTESDIITAVYQLAEMSQHGRAALEIAEHYKRTERDSIAYLYHLLA